MRALRLMLKLVLGTVVLVLVTGGVAAFVLFQRLDAELPDYRQLAAYSPPTVTRVHAADGRLIAEYARERRVFVPVSAIPDRVKNAFIAAEDQNFYHHPGIDVQGIVRAALANLEQMGTGRRPGGASTITQQVAKNFLLSNELSITRKLKEAILAMRIERAFTKDQILELYLNEIFLGFRSYGVAAASLNYFDKSLDDLSIAEAAFLAGLPKAPSSYDPRRNAEAARDRRNYVISRMLDDGYIGAADAEAARGGAADRPDRNRHRRRRRPLLRRGGPPPAGRPVRRGRLLRGRALGAHHRRPRHAGAGRRGPAARARRLRPPHRLSRPLGPAGGAEGWAATGRRPSRPRMPASSSGGGSARSSWTRASAACGSASRTAARRPCRPTSWPGPAVVAATSPAATSS